MALTLSDEVQGKKVEEGKRCVGSPRSLRRLSFQHAWQGDAALPPCTPSDSLPLTRTANQSEEIDVKYKKLTKFGA